MSNTTDLITALVNIGAFVGKDEKGRIVAKFDGRINTSVDENQHLHIYHKGSDECLAFYERGRWQMNAGAGWSAEMMMKSISILKEHGGR